MNRSLRNHLQRSECPIRHNPKLWSLRQLKGARLGMRPKHQTPTLQEISQLLAVEKFRIPQFLIRKSNLVKKAESSLRLRHQVLIEEIKRQLRKLQNGILQVSLLGLVQANLEESDLELLLHGFNKLQPAIIRPRDSMTQSNQRLIKILLKAVQMNLLFHSNQKIPMMHLITRIQW